MTINVVKNAKIANAIEKWFKGAARDFPWRNKDTPWGRLLSELMAQQTQINRVAEKWVAMIERFPSPAAMAESDLYEVLLLWQGLGYYRRARYLKEASEQICSEFGGEVPQTVNELLTLKGVGKYTAGAVASMAFNNREPIVDGNVHRVVCRLNNEGEYGVNDSWTWEMAQNLVNGCYSPSKFNEGLMELGATVCTPKKTKCHQCPVSSMCSAFKKGSQFEVPKPKVATAKQKEFHYAVLFQKKNKIALEHRDTAGLWAGMWQVPTIESTKKLTKKEIGSHFEAQNGLAKIGSFMHTLTHKTIEFNVFECSNSAKKLNWYDSSNLNEFPFANAQKKVLSFAKPNSIN